jgi:hypothetical protein
MRKCQWEVHRHMVPTRDAQRRWDQVYQYLVLWKRPSLAYPLESQTQTPQEECDESCDIRTCLYATASTDTND